MQSRAPGIALRAAGVAAASAAGAFLVWFAGFDWLWAVTAVLAVGSVGAVFAVLKFEDSASCDARSREAPRGVRLTVPMMEESLAACDRLARPAITRPIRVLLTNERDDRLARGTLTRQMRALLLTELRAHGITPARQTDEGVVALLGRDALTVLQPTDDNPVTSAVITNSIDAVERLHTDMYAS